MWSRIKVLQDKLIRLRMFVEATLDFPEEDVEFIEAERAREKLSETRAALEHVITEAGRGQLLHDGIRIVLAGEPKTPEHMQRHPFGKVPVLDHDGVRILETSAIVRYLNDVLPGKSLVPASPKDRACMDMMIGIIDSYGYGALLGGIAAYHLFPDFVGGKNEAMRKTGIESGRKVIALAMQTRGASPFIAGELSLADLYLAPIAAYVSMTPDADAVFGVDGFAAWWASVQALKSFQDTQPKPG